MHFAWTSVTTTHHSETFPSIFIGTRRYAAIRIFPFSDKAAVVGPYFPFCRFGAISVTVTNVSRKNISYRAISGYEMRLSSDFLGPWPRGDGSQTVGRDRSGQCSLSVASILFSVAYEIVSLIVLWYGKSWEAHFFGMLFLMGHAILLVFFFGSSK